jgi:hypothetical protein
MIKKPTTNNNIYQKPLNAQQYQEKPANRKKDSHEVRQDGRAPGFRGVASFYASRAGKSARARELDKQNIRVKKRSTRRQTLQATTWLPRPISLQVDRTASDMHFTRSRATRHLVELGLANDILGKHVKVIVEALAQAAKQETRRNLRPYRDNSYRSAFYAAQDRTLLTNILHLLCRLLQEPPDTTERIIRRSEQDARDALKILTPQLAELIRNQEKRQYGTQEQEEPEEREE